MSASPRKLFIVSYRVPEISNNASAGGLVVALSPFFKESASNTFFDEVILCGFGGTPTDTPDNSFTIEAVPGKARLKRAILKPTKTEQKEVYTGYLNGVRWLLAHGLIDKIDLDAVKYYTAYRAQTRRFAQAFAPLITSKHDLIKAEDYHLEFLADELRSLGMNENVMAHMEHIPQTRVSDFHALPLSVRGALEGQENDLNRAKLAYDLLAFQRASDVGYFKEHIGIFGRTAPTFEVERALLSGRTTKIGVFPASIDTNIDAATASMPLTDEEMALIDPEGHINPKAKKISWGGRADKSKNVPNSYDDITAILQDSEFVREIQNTYGLGDLIPLHAYGISTPTRQGVKGYDEEEWLTEGAYQNLVITHDDGSKYLPATLNTKGLPRDTLLRHYRDTIGYFISWRDGQHLGAFEHQAAQNPNCPYPVIVSREAGASDNLPGALIVDPANRLECRAALKRAVLMPQEEACARHAANMRVLREQDSPRQISAQIYHMLGR